MVEEKHIKTLHSISRKDASCNNCKNRTDCRFKREIKSQTIMLCNMAKYGCVHYKKEK